MTFKKEMFKNTIICGFPGVGKSTAAAKSKEIVDCESTSFHYLPGNLTTENPNWVKDYVDHIGDLSSNLGYQYVLLSCHKAVREELARRGVPYVIVAPSSYCRSEYMARYLKRGDSVKFIKNVYDNWAKWLDEIEEDGMPVIWLNEGQTISDVLPIM